MRQVDYVIIGAGLTGLVTAYELQKRGFSVAVLEKEQRYGGFIETVFKDVFTYERGPNSGVFSNPHVAELLDELADSFELEIANEKVKNRFILKDGNWEKLPLSPIELMTSKLFSTKDKWNLLLEPFKPKATQTETLQELITRRFGQSILDYAIDPFIGGIYAGDPAKLVPKYALPKMYALEQNHGSFIGGALRKALTKKSPREKRATRQIYSFTGGLDKLTKVLYQSIDENNMILSAQSPYIEQKDDHYHTTFTLDSSPQGIISDNVISTIRGDDIDTLFPTLDSSLTGKLKSMTYARIIEVTIGFKSWTGMELNGFGGLIPHKENRRLLGVLFLSSCFKNRAPHEGALLTAFIGGVRNDHLCDLPDSEIKSLLKEELSDLLQMKNYNPDLIEIGRHNRAIPQYDILQGERLKAIAQIEETNPGFHILGNIRDGIGMADRIQQAREFVLSIGKENL